MDCPTRATIASGTARFRGESINGLAAHQLVRRGVGRGREDQVPRAGHHQAAMDWLHIGWDELSHWEEAVNAQFDAA